MIFWTRLSPFQYETTSYSQLVRDRTCDVQAPRLAAHQHRNCHLQISALGTGGHVLLRAVLWNARGSEPKNCHFYTGQNLSIQPVQWEWESWVTHLIVWYFASPEFQFMAFCITLNFLFIFLDYLIISSRKWKCNDVNSHMGMQICDQFEITILTPFMQSFACFIQLSLHSLKHCAEISRKYDEIYECSVPFVLLARFNSLFASCSGRVVFWSNFKSRVPRHFTVIFSLTCILILHNSKIPLTYISLLSFYFPFHQREYYN